MISDSPHLLPATAPDPAGECVGVAPDPLAADRQAGVVPVVVDAPALLAVTPRPIVTAHPGRREDGRVADALERLREALVAAGQSLDRVAVGISGADAISGVTRSTGS